MKELGRYHDHLFLNLALLKASQNGSSVLILQLLLKMRIYTSITDSNGNP
jgi:hypothetical protein